MYWLGGKPPILNSLFGSAGSLQVTDKGNIWWSGNEETLKAYDIAIFGAKIAPYNSRAAA